MSIASVTTFVTASLVAVGIALAVLVAAVGVAAVQFFSANHRVRVARHEPLVAYYRNLALG
ncbi:hypothetical protein N5P18_10600 [Janibacter terrae]|uniref:Uncharacterized protein n=1 Tax=Janibacter terrae TaxID=103817 RepID=A0ABZ2FC89_9MICO|nr:hypothetical protein [Kytococcus sp.]HCE60180.1 hypothetical protein [Janibacter terrae]